MGCSHSTTSTELALLGILEKNIDLKPFIAKLKEGDGLDAFVALKETKHLDIGETLVSAGDIDQNIYYVAKGTLLVWSSGQLSGYFQNGQLVGVLQFLENIRHVDTIKAAKRSIVFKLSRSSYDRIIFDVKTSLNLVPLFESLSPVKRNFLLSHCEVRKLSRFETVIWKDDNPTKFYVILKGQVLFNGKLKGYMDYFGEDELLFKTRYPGNAVVQSADAVLFVLSELAFNSSEFVIVRQFLESESRLALGEKRPPNPKVKKKRKSSKSSGEMQSLGSQKGESTSTELTTMSNSTLALGVDTDEIWKRWWGVGEGAACGSDVSIRNSESIAGGTVPERNSVYGEVTKMSTSTPAKEATLVMASTLPAIKSKKLRKKSVTTKSATAQGIHRADSKSVTAQEVHGDREGDTEDVGCSAGSVAILSSTDDEEDDSSCLVS